MHAGSCFLLQKENICSILEISNANLTNSTLLQTALNTTCMMKDILDTLATAEVAVMGQDSEEDVEISAVKILVRRIYLESCEMVRDLQLSVHVLLECCYLCILL